MNTDKIEVTQQEDEAFATMTKDNEHGYWENGDPCFWNGIKAKFVGRSNNMNTVAIIEIMDGFVNKIDTVFINELSKPESQKQKAERERLELVQKACLTVRHDYGLMSNYERNRLEFEGVLWLKAFEKEGLQKDKS